MLKGKTAIVTGSTSGIGLGIARALATAGCDVMLNGFGEAAAIEHERAQIAKDFGARAALNAADMAKPAEIAKMVEAATGELGGVDILDDMALSNVLAPGNAVREEVHAARQLRRVPWICSSPNWR